MTWVTAVLIAIPWLAAATLAGMASAAAKALISTRILTFACLGQVVLAATAAAGLWTWDQLLPAPKIDLRDRTPESVAILALGGWILFRNPATPWAGVLSLLGIGALQWAYWTSDVLSQMLALAACGGLLSLWLAIPDANNRPEDRFPGGRRVLIWCAAADLMWLAALIWLNSATNSTWPLSQFARAADWRLLDDDQQLVAQTAARLQLISLAIRFGWFPLSGWLRSFPHDVRKLAAVLGIQGAMGWVLLATWGSWWLGSADLRGFLSGFALLTAVLASWQAVAAETPALRRGYAALGLMGLTLVGVALAPGMVEIMVSAVAGVWLLSAVLTSEASEAEATRTSLLLMVGTVVLSCGLLGQERIWDAIWASDPTRRVAFLTLALLAHAACVAALISTAGSSRGSAPRFDAGALGGLAFIGCAVIISQGGVFRDAERVRFVFPSLTLLSAGLGAALAAVGWPARFPPQGLPVGPTNSLQQLARDQFWIPQLAELGWSAWIRFNAVRERRRRSKFDRGPWARLVDQWAETLQLIDDAAQAPGARSRQLLWTATALTVGWLVATWSR